MVGKKIRTAMFESVLDFQRAVSVSGHHKLLVQETRKGENH